MPVEEQPFRAAKVASYKTSVKADLSLMPGGRAAIYGREKIAVKKPRFSAGAFKKILRAAGPRVAKRSVLKDQRRGTFSFLR
jgi:hypothetical protein